MDAESQPGSHSSKRKRKLPAGMSDYQAAWIAEEDLEGLAESASEDEGEADATSQGARKMQSGDGQSVFMPDLEDDDETDDMQVHSGAIPMQSKAPALCTSLRLWPCYLEQELPISTHPLLFKVQILALRLVFCRAAFGFLLCIVNAVGKSLQIAPTKQSQIVAPKTQSAMVFVVPSACRNLL